MSYPGIALALGFSQCFLYGAIVVGFIHTIKHDTK